MEEFPSSLPEAKSNDNPDKKKKAKKGANLRLPKLAAVEDESKDNSARPEIPALSKTLAQLLEKDANDKQSDTAETKSEAASEHAKEADESSATSETTDKETESAEDDYESLPRYEPEPVEFSGGEVIIHLNGDQPVAERVIPLHAETTEPAAPPDPEPLPVFTPQVLPQHQAGPSEAAPETPAELPPEQPAAPPEAVSPIAPSELPPRTFAERSPTPLYPPVEILPRQPEQQAAFASAMPNVAPTAPGGEQVATKQDVENAVYRATKAGQNQGLLTGLLVGGGYEHLKHKRREKRQEKRQEKQLKQQQKELRQARTDSQLFMAEQVNRRPEEGRRLSAVEQRFRNTSSREKALPKPAALPAIAAPEQLDIPTDHRLETSTWHSIEVDTKTGKPVENPAFQYGHEYYRERAPENVPVDQRNAAAGEVALVAASAGGTPNATLPQTVPAIPNATTQGPPPPTGRFAPNGTKQSPPAADPKASAPIWPWLVALVVIAICLIALLH